jgi:DNA-binding response OmpR family regulator
MGKKVLIVDDEPELLALMADTFRKADIEVYTAGNGEVALELFHHIRPDLVITDIVMPAKEGVSLIMDIRKSLPDASVIAISGGGTRSCKDYLRWAKELGAALVLQKPFRMSILLMMARFLMEKAAARAAPEPTAVRPAQAQSGQAQFTQAQFAEPKFAEAPAQRTADLNDIFDDLFEAPKGFGASFNPI